jgi:predicted metal-dependent peptidase
MDDFDMIGRLNSAYNILPRGGLAQQTLLLGYPVFMDSEEIPTACVGYSNDRRLQFFWNRAFFETLELADIAYVAAHEATHVLLHHVARRENRDPQAWNVACDVVVNRIVDRICGIYPSNALSGRIVPQMVGLSSAQVDKMTTEEIYEKLPKTFSLAIIAGMIDDHDKWDSIPDEVCTSIEHSLSVPKDKRAQRMFGYGKETNGELARLRRRLCRPFDWERLLRNRLATARKPTDGDNWTRPNRKMYQWYPDVLLPGAAEKEKCTSLILVSIDTSGSMAEEDIEKMVALVGSLPEDQYEVHLTWFDTGVYHVKDVCIAQGRGGTSFNCIEDVAIQQAEIQGKDGKRLDRYPDVVVCMTDGIAAKPQLSRPDRWIWIITEQGSKKSVNDLGSTVWKL